MMMRDRPKLKKSKKQGKKLKQQSKWKNSKSSKRLKKRKLRKNMLKKWHRQALLNKLGWKNRKPWKKNSER